MTATQHLIAFVAMATAITAILVIGTLAAADILLVGRHRRDLARSAPDQRADGPVSPVGKHGHELAASGAGHGRADR